MKIEGNIPDFTLRVSDSRAEINSRNSSKNYLLILEELYRGQGGPETVRQGSLDETAGTEEFQHNKNIHKKSLNRGK